MGEKSDGWMLSDFPASRWDEKGAGVNGHAHRGGFCESQREIVRECECLSFLFVFESKARAVAQYVGIRNEVVQGSTFCSIKIFFSCLLRLIAYIHIYIKGTPLSITYSHSLRLDREQITVCVLRLARCDLQFAIFEITQAIRHDVVLIGEHAIVVTSVAHRRWHLLLVRRCSRVSGFRLHPEHCDEEQNGTCVWCISIKIQAIAIFGQSTH